MTSSSARFLLPLMCLLPIIAGEVLQVDNEGQFSVSQKETGTPRIPVCFDNEGAAECTPGEKLSISVRRMKDRRGIARSDKKSDDFDLNDFIYYTMVYNIFFTPQQQYSYTAPPRQSYLGNNYLSIIPNNHYLAHDYFNTPIYVERKNSVFYDRYRQSSNEKGDLPEIIPLKSSGCLPVNSTVCEPHHVEAYDEFLKKASSSARSLNTEAQKGNDEDENDFEDKLEKKLENAKDIVQHVVDKVKNDLSTDGGPVTIHTLDLVFKDLDLRSARVKLEESVSEKPQARSSYQRNNQRSRGNF